MVNLLIGVAAGFVGGFVVKGQSSKNESISPSGQPYSILYNEAMSNINKLKLELKNRDSEIEELNNRIKSLNKKLRDREDEDDDIIDNISYLRKTIEELRQKNHELTESISDYKSLYLAAKQEIERLKE